VPDKELVWISTSYKDLRDTPEEVQDAVGYALDLAQRGEQAAYAEDMSGPLKGVTAIHTDDDTGKSTFRTTYTTTLGDVVYVLDTFQKKTKKKGIETPKMDLDRIAGRFKKAKELHEEAERRKRT
jgi:phage-related protein